MVAVKNDVVFYCCKVAFNVAGGCIGETTNKEHKIVFV